MLKEIVKSIFLLLMFTAICTLAYPAVVTLAASAMFKNEAAGSLVYDEVNKSAPIASTLIGQNFSKKGYFHPRPSAAGDKGYDPLSSGGSNYGYTSQKLYDSVKDRVKKYRDENDLDAKEKVPMDAVTASASGLDPHISIENAKLQVARVAKDRNITELTVDKLVENSTEHRFFGFLGVEKINVVKLNLSLDRDFGKAKN